MAKRSREHRQDIPGYDETRPSREERKQQHRANRHATNQVLHSIDDPDEVVLPEERRTRKQEPVIAANETLEPGKRRFRVWKTKFWKRRNDYRDNKAAIDANWPVIDPEELRET
jgi:hypothetical protein